MLVLAGKATDDAHGHRLAREALASGSALDKFRDLIAAQGGDPRVIEDPSRLPLAEARMPIVAGRSGYVADLDAEAVGIAALELGAGRAKAEDRIDPAVGILVLKKPGEAVKAGEAVFEIHHNGKGLSVAMAD